jgi:hypothetical protein
MSQNISVSFLDHTERWYVQALQSMSDVVDESVGYGTNMTLSTVENKGTLQLYTKWRLGLSGKYPHPPPHKKYIFT